MQVVLFPRHPLLVGIDFWVIASIIYHLRLRTRSGFHIMIELRGLLHESWPIWTDQAKLYRMFLTRCRFTYAWWRERRNWRWNSYLLTRWTVLNAFVLSTRCLNILICKTEEEDDATPPPYIKWDVHVEIEYIISTETEMAAMLIKFTVHIPQPLKSMYWRERLDWSTSTSVLYTFHELMIMRSVQQ